MGALYVEVVNMSDFKAVDEAGRPVKLNTYMKNKMYRRAKELREEIRGRQCTKSECWNPTQENVDKMIKSEMTHVNERKLYSAIMGNLGADPNDGSTERLRRGR